MSASAEQARVEAPTIVEPSPRSVARREMGRFLRFLAVGAFSFVVDTGALSLLVFGFGTNRVIAKGVGFCLAVLSNFIWNRFWIYTESRSKAVSAQLIQLFVISLVGLGINLAVFAVVDGAVRSSIGPTFGLYVAQALAVGTALIWNFVANRLITYGDVKLGR